MRHRDLKISEALSMIGCTGWRRSEVKGEIRDDSEGGKAKPVISLTGKKGKSRGRGTTFFEQTFRMVWF